MLSMRRCRSSASCRRALAVLAFDVDCCSNFHRCSMGTGCMRLPAKEVNVPTCTLPLQSVLCIFSMWQLLGSCAQVAGASLATALPMAASRDSRCETLAPLCRATGCARTTA
jgi:hypothetical protein